MDNGRQIGVAAALSLCVLLLVACQGRGTPSPEVLAIIESARYGSSATSTVRPALTEPAAYLIAERDNPPYLHRLFRVPNRCFLDGSGCSSAQVIGAFPEEGITPSHLFWSPFGEFAIILDTYGARILLLNPSKGEMKTLFNGIGIISDDLVWLSDGRALLVVQGSTDYSSDMVALNLLNGVPGMETIHHFEGLAYLLGTLTNGHILLRVDIYGLTDPTKPGKENVIAIQAVEVDPTTGKIYEYLPGINWFVNKPVSLMSDGYHLLVSTGDKTLLWDVRGDERLDLGSMVIWPTGSPDGKSVAYIQQSPDVEAFSLSILSLGDGHLRELGDFPVSSRPFWSPDSRMIVLGQFELGASADLGSLRVIDVGTGNEAIPSIDLGEYPVVLDVSWGP